MSNPWNIHLLIFFSTNFCTHSPGQLLLRHREQLTCALLLLFVVLFTRLVSSCCFEIRFLNASLDELVRKCRKKSVTVMPNSTDLTFFFLDLRIWTVVKIRIFYFFLSRTFYDQFSSKNEASFLHKSSCLSNRWTVRFFGYYPDFETNECRWRRCRCLMWCNIEHWRGFDSIKSVDLPVSLYEGGEAAKIGLFPSIFFTPFII